jgi:hypothetical protein
VILRNVGLIKPLHPVIVINRAPRSQNAARDILRIGMLCFLTIQVFCVGLRKLASIGRGDVLSAT